MLSLFLPKVIFFFVLSLPLHTMAAGDISLSTEFRYTHSNATSTDNDTGDFTKSDISIFEQGYNIKMKKELYPFVSIDGGADFELDEFKTTSDDVTFESTAQKIRPFVGLSLRSPLYAAGIVFRSTALKDEFPDFPATRNFQKNVNMSFAYRPSGLPQLNFFHDRFHNYDEAKTTDLISKQSTATVSYYVKESPVRYSYRRNESDNRLTGSETLQERHTANTSYKRTFFNRRVALNASYGVNFDIRKVPVSGTAASSVSAVQGLFSADDTPQGDPALSAVSALIDGNVTASSGINIGWTDATEPDRNIGLDFGFPVSVDRLFVYVDRNVPAQASNTLSWSIYVSSENTDMSVWTLHAVISPAQFGIFNNRFELSFPAVSTRFIKVVVSPLAATFSGISELENIFITEMESFVTISGTEEEKRVDSTHNFSSQLNAKLSDKTSMGYNITSILRKEDADPSSERLTLTNGVYLRHIFNRIFSATATVAREERKRTSDVEGVDRNVNHELGSIVSVAYLPTLSQSLSFSADQTESDEGRFENSSLLLRTSAALYRGWDAYSDIGYSQSESASGELTGLTFSAETSVIPNEQISLDLRYSESKDTNKQENTTITERDYDVQVSYVPFRYLSIFARLFISEGSNKDTSELQTYSVSWSPFPDGDLQIFLSHSESLRPSDDKESRSTGGNIRWEINRYAILLVSYFYSSSKTVVETTDDSTITAELDMNF